MFLGVVTELKSVSVFNFSGIRFKLVGQDLKQRCFSSAVKSKDYNARALIDNARNVGKDFKGAIVLGKFLTRQGSLATRRRCWEAKFCHLIFDANIIE